MALTGETKTVTDLIKSNRSIFLSAIVISGLLNIIMAILVFMYSSEAKEHVYFISENAAYKGVALDSKERNDAEMKNHSFLFMYNMFSHDQYNYEKRVNKALLLIDKPSGMYLYKQLSDAKIIDKYRKYNSRTELEVDSVLIDHNSNPITARAYCKQYAVYSDHREKLPLAAKFGVVSTFRSDANPHGLQLVNFEVIAYDRAIKEIQEKQEKQANEGTNE